eukprot:3629569-Pyramimonas_sp.AAC.1
MEDMSPTCQATNGNLYFIDGVVENALAKAHKELGVKATRGPLHLASFAQSIPPTASMPSALHHLELALRPLVLSRSARPSPAFCPLPRPPLRPPPSSRNVKRGLSLPLVSTPASRPRKKGGRKMVQERT